MDSAAVNDVTSSYLYDANGIRTRKTVGSTVTEYFTNGSTILAEKTGSNVLWYIYDSDGEILGFTYTGTPYYYIKNVQGDVYKVVNASGTEVASYTYDPWGKVISSSGSMANINPIRYRSYYYDTETGFYYLQSRYYDPETGRFINADGINYLGVNGTVLSFNLFAYCENNPVLHKDSSGKFINAIIGAITGALFSALSFFLEYWFGMRSLNWWDFARTVAIAAAVGAVGGYLSGWMKFARIAKHARLPGMLVKLKSPVIRSLVYAANKGVSYIINSFVKSLSRKPGESWSNALRRWLRV